MNKTKYRAISTLVATGVNLILNVALIPDFGAYGAAVATLASFAVRHIIDSYYSQMLFPVKYEWRKIVQVSLTCFTVLLMSYLIRFDYVGFSLISPIVMLACFAAVVFSGILTTEERVLIKRFVS